MLANLLYIARVSLTENPRVSLFLVQFPEVQKILVFLMTFAPKTQTLINKPQFLSKIIIIRLKNENKKMHEFYALNMFYKQY
jgi:hypothetical protein